MTSVTWYLVVAFDASGNPMAHEFVPYREEADDLKRQWKNEGNDWVKIISVTSPPVPYGQ